MESGCWEWQNSTDADGYSKYWHEGAMRLAHRVAYVELVEQVPDDVEIRHDCDNPPCVKPNHSRTGTHSDNMQDSLERGRNAFRKKTRCPQGHPYDEENTYADPSGRRHCRTCMREAGRRYRQRNVGGKARKAGEAA
ncbi:HNH endonuclease [Streptomyces sp900129855]|uniref:HNH endonuclease n=1 Tax=Streptomyces sp. 900129855 TaxID=3155129 RepID=A0ABV2ZRP1_9ACTN